jgi:hypothetical protein
MFAIPSCTIRSFVVLIVLSCVWYLDEGVFQGNSSSLNQIEQRYYSITKRSVPGPISSISAGWVASKGRLASKFLTKTHRRPMPGSLTAMARAD